MTTKNESMPFDSGSEDCSSGGGDSGGGESKSSTERINNALQKIRSELSEIRGQDLKLLKQLIQISETIKRLSEDRLSKRRTWYGQRQSMCSESAELYLDIEPLTPDLDDYREAILIRQFSEPISFSRDDLLDFRTHPSIFDAPISIDPLEESWPPTFSRVHMRHRPHSVSILTSSRSYGMESSQERMEDSDKSYEEILERNIRLWKGRQSVHISDDDEEDGSRTPVNDWGFFAVNGSRSPISASEVKNAHEKRLSDSGSSSGSSLVNSSGSSYSSSAFNGGSSRDSSGSYNSYVFTSIDVDTADSLATDLVDKTCTDTANNRTQPLPVSEPVEKNDFVSGNDENHFCGNNFDSQDLKNRKDNLNTDLSLGDNNDDDDDDDSETPVVEIRGSVSDWLESDNLCNREKQCNQTPGIRRDSEVVSLNREQKRSVIGIEVTAAGSMVECFGEGNVDLLRKRVADGTSCAPKDTLEDLDKDSRVQQRDLESGRETGLQMIRGDEGGGREKGESEEGAGVRGRGEYRQSERESSRDRGIEGGTIGEGGGRREDRRESGELEKDRNRDRIKDGGEDVDGAVAGTGRGGREKAKAKEGGSGSGGVVRALLDHIGRKIENRVTVGMAEYSRSFLPVISEISKRDSRQKANPHRPRELDIT